MQFIYLFLLIFVLSQECDWNYGIPGDHNKVSDDDTRRNLIVSGQAATPHEYPWYVQILPAGCGGSIISRNFILTAGHCDIGVDPTIVVGLNKQSIKGKFIVHEEYNQFSLVHSLLNDIAVVELATPLPCGDPTIQAIGLYEAVSDFSIDGCSAWATGLGALQSDGASPPGYQLHEVQTRVWDTDYCNQAPQNIFNLPASQLCGFTPVGTNGQTTEDSCQGDSGGPFKVDIRGDSIAYHEYVQVGIVSYGVGCGDSAGIYTDVSQYKDWVLSKDPNAHFVKVEQCDTEHYHEGIIDCEGQDCFLDLPPCHNIPNWTSESGNSCSDYTGMGFFGGASQNDCFVDQSNGFWAYQVCSECDFCRDEPDDTTPAIFTDTTDCTGTEEVVQWQVVTQTWAHEISFEITTSTGQTVCTGTGFHDATGYTGNCCLPKNDDLLIECADEFGDGWHGAELLINNEVVCGNFEATEYTVAYTVSGGVDEDNNDNNNNGVGIGNGVTESETNSSAMMGIIVAGIAVVCILGSIFYASALAKRYGKEASSSSKYAGTVPYPHEGGDLTSPLSPPPNPTKTHQFPKPPPKRIYNYKEPVQHPRRNSLWKMQKVQPTATRTLPSAPNRSAIESNDVKLAVAPEKMSGRAPPPLPKRTNDKKISNLVSFFNKKDGI